MAKTDKTDKKIKKIDKKTGRKCGALIAFLALSAILCGCLHPEGQPSRSQTQNNDFNHCIVIVAARCGVTNETVVAESADSLMPIELFTQTMKNEGSEQNSPTMTPTQTTDVSPKTDVNTTGGRTAGVIDSLIGSFGTWLATPSGKKAVANCVDGNCSDGSCADGSCSACTVK